MEVVVVSDRHIIVFCLQLKVKNDDQTTKNSIPPRVVLFGKGVTSLSQCSRARKCMVQYSYEEADDDTTSLREAMPYFFTVSPDEDHDGHHSENDGDHGTEEGEAAVLPGLIARRRP